MSDETKQKYAQKRLIHVTKEQEERMARQSHERIQNFVNELNQMQARRFELTSGIVLASVTRDGLPGGETDRVAMVNEARALANQVVESDAKQKWEALKSLFVELNVPAPQPPLEWAAKQVGVTLFDVLPEEPEAMIVAPSTEELIKVTQ